MFTKKGFCRYLGIRCRHLDLRSSCAVCKKTGDLFFLPTLYGKNISSRNDISISAPDTCPRLRKH